MELDTYLVSLSLHFELQFATQYHKVYLIGAGLHILAQKEGRGSQDGREVDEGRKGREEREKKI